MTTMLAHLALDEIGVAEIRVAMDLGHVVVELDLGGKGGKLNRRVGGDG